MAKATRRGEVKTRLVPPLRAEEAAILSGCFLQDSTENFIAASKTVPVQGYVAYSPPGSEALFRDLVLPQILLLPPRRIGLGYSLLHAAEDLLYAGYCGSWLFNADRPTLPSSELVAALEALLAPSGPVMARPASVGRASLFRVAI